MENMNYIKYQGNLGLPSPFYLNQEPSHTNLNFNNILSNNEKSTIDSQSIIEISMRGYILGNRTLVKGVNRIPFISSYNESTESFQRNFSIDFYDSSSDDISLVVKLKELLIEEALTYIEDSEDIGILLSGGMDSRILAGILREIEVNIKPDIKIHVFNWGINNSRDVIYAKQISEKYRWEYHNFELSSEVIKANFIENITLGCETSPINLHSMKKVRDFKGVNKFLAASYGDSLGRAEYNGNKIEKAPDVVYENINKRGVIKTEAIKKYEISIKEEQQAIFKDLPTFPNKYIKKEFEYHQSHSRRHLTSAMSLIAQKKDLFQLFTSPKLVSYLWSLPLSLRYDKLYWLLLQELPSELMEIPWARTGRKFYENTGEADGYESKSHRYGEWLRGDLKSYILDLVESENIYNIGLFNEKVLEMKIKEWKKDNSKNVTSTDSFLSWLANFSLLISSKNLKSEEEFTYNFKDNGVYVKQKFIDAIKKQIK